MTSTVADKTAAVLDMEPDWELARALLGGTRAMRKAGESHLPKWPNEDADAYKCRLATAVLFPAYQRTVQTLTGKPFSKPITLGEDVPTSISAWLQDIDLQGRNLDAFAADSMESAIGYGIAGILVDYPKAEGVRTLAQERAAGLRPYWIQIHPWQVLGWVASRVGGSWSLLQLRLMECAEEADGDFAVKSVDQVRVLEPGKWATYRQNDKKEWVPHEDGVTSLQYIPYVPVYGGRTGFMTGKPPLIEVAHLNVAHWQSASDQQTILHVARVPILTVIGVDQDDKWSMTVGASAAVKLPIGGDMKFVEHTGKAIEAGANELDALEERMRQAGAELLVIAPGKITATQVQTENAVGMCALQRITQGLEDAIDQALQITADWVGEKQGGHATLFNDYGAASLQEASADLLLKANQAGKLSDESFHGELQRRGILSADVDWQVEKDRLDEQGPALGMLGEVDPLTGKPAEVDPLTGEAKPVAKPADAAPQAAAPDFGPLIAAMHASNDKPAPMIDWAPLIDALKNQPQPILEMDVTPLADAMVKAIQSIPSPTVHVEQPSHTFNIDASQAAQPAPIVNLPPITVEGNTINVAPAAAPDVTIPVNVTVEKSGSKTGTLKKQDDGSFAMEVTDKP